MFGFVTEWVGWMNNLDKRVPIHLQEPFRRHYNAWDPVTEDFYRGCTGAKVAEAAGWCLHNGGTHGAAPWKCFVMTDSEGRLYSQLDTYEDTVSYNINGQIGSTSTLLRRYQAEYSEQLSHSVGRKQGLVWSANVTDDSAGYMSYGPYVDTIPAGNHTAAWKLMIDDNSSNNDQVATLTVYCGTVLAQKALYRKDFTAADTWQTFTLSFTSTGQQNLEFRTNWLDKCYLQLSYVDLTIHEVGWDAPVTSFAATPSSGQVSLKWWNPQTSEWAGTMVRFKTTGYPTGPTDGTQCYNGTGSSYVHTGLTNGTTYYYRAYAYDAVPNYATAAQVSATPVAVTVISNSTFNSNADGWTTSVWRAGTLPYGTMAWNASAGYPGGGMRCKGSETTDNTDRCSREGGEIQKVISTAGHSGIKVYYDLDVNTLGGNYTGAGTGSCWVDHDIIDEQLRVFYSTNGGTDWIGVTWLTRVQLLADYLSYGTRTLDLTGVSACNNNANFAMRFRWQLNSTADTAQLDNIRVEANN